MNFRRVHWVRIVSMLCMVAALGLGLQSAQASRENLQHRTHGDVATSDGGWIIAPCEDRDLHCTFSGDRGTDVGDGHHHHVADNQTNALPPAIADPAFAPLQTSLAFPTAARLPDDADLGRPGHVPRASTPLS